MTYVRWFMILVGITVGYVALSWFYTNIVLNRARSNGTYPSAEAGMLALMDQYYAPDREVKFYYA